MILSANMLTLLSMQYGHELSNSLFYSALQSWAEMHGLEGTAAYFKSQAEGERSHADLVLSYIHDRNEQLDAYGIATTGPAERTFVSVFMEAQARERQTTEQIWNIYRQGEKEGDIATCAWLYGPTGLILEQIEEERNIQTILDRITARRGLVTLDNEDGGSVMAEMPGEVIHDIDVWLKARA